VLVGKLRNEQECVPLLLVWLKNRCLQSEKVCVEWVTVADIFRDVYVVDGFVQEILSFGPPEYVLPTSLYVLGIC
jgi:hypothetical protein